jgi:hypothetical protein
MWELLIRTMGYWPGSANWSSSYVSPGTRLQVTGYRLQVTGYRLQVTGYRLQVEYLSSIDVLSRPGCREGVARPERVGSKNSADLQIPNSVRLTEATISRSQPIGKPSLTPDGARVRGRLVSHELRPTPLATLLPDSL